MSDGGGENVKEGGNNLNHLHSKKRRTRVDDFGFSIARVAVAQICEAAGFQGFQRAALDTLSDVAVRHILEIGKTGNMFANLAGRSQCNVFDIIQGLEDLGSIQGFAGASDVHHCLLGSGTVREMVRYVGEAEEIPFAYSLPGFPVLKEREPGRTFEQTGVSPPAEHIPPWLPVFPDPENYVNLHRIDEKTSQIWEDEVRGPVEKRRELDNTLSNLQQRMACNGSQPSVVFDIGNEAKEKGSGERNPFLAPPLQHGEKEVSLVLPPAKLSDEVFLQSTNLEVPVSHMSAMETFAPSTEAVKSGTFDLEGGRKEVPLNRRSNVQFKLADAKKYLRVAISSQKQGIDRNSSWFRSDDGTDDKKRRAEQILKQSYESAGTDSLVN